jgi:hypothetical protein
MPCNQAVSNQIITIYQTQQPNIRTIYQTQQPNILTVYHKSHQYRVPSDEYRYIQYLITTRLSTQFLRTIVLVAQLRVQHMHSHQHGTILPLILRTNLFSNLNVNALAIC